jgi:hypothetical protein
MSKFTSFLKTAGELVANGALSYFGMAPIFKPAAPSGTAVTVAGELEQIAASAIQIEAIGKTTGLTGVQKMQALEPQVYAILQESLALGNDPIADPTLAQQGASEIAQGMVDFINALKPNSLKATVQPIAIAPAVSTAAPAASTAAPAPPAA